MELITLHPEALTAGGGSLRCLPLRPSPGMPVQAGQHHRPVLHHRMQAHGVQRMLQKGTIIDKDPFSS
ncbi:MAG: hypothetical protein AB1611_18745 [bacterium]